ncbi:hypothetical protein ElyMa_001617700 [Elysia marginata]|uniref:Uncharacterized protein n=1 Tax=Elysia marginata TaxID=1093978 RepID=A0AAV4JLV2_9GAST|nr:hypothetical protein ElyMa_001617700 [Elysia marginata]
MGHCNVKDLLSLQGAANGMNISDAESNKDFECEIVHRSAVASLQNPEDENDGNNIDTAQDDDDSNTHLKVTMEVLPEFKNLQMEVLPDPYIFYPLSPWRAQGKGGHFAFIKTSGDNGHPRRSTLKADPRSVSISPLSESSGAGAIGGG